MQNNKKKPLTTESIKKLFPNSFALTNYVIKIAQERIAEGQEDIDIDQLIQEVYLEKKKEKESLQG
ncbi:MAG: hypothetical protein VXZ72_05130 [Chlamydiota bacterium]|nr:hypothetical protein [Chlamydiota bacterium]